MLGTMMYGYGAYLPCAIANSSFETADYHFMTEAIYKGIGYFAFVKFILIFVLVVITAIVLANIFPKKNYMIQRMFGIIGLLLLLLVGFFSFIPILLGTTLGAAGWLGFSIICLYGIAFLANAIYLRIEKIKQEMYGKDYALKSSCISNIWARLKKVWLLAFALIIINIFTLRICMWGEFNLWSLPWLFAGPIYFGIVALFTCGPLKMFITSFYFAKYAQHYRALWQVSDEQWYGKRRAKKLAKKKLKLEKRGK